jgi:hypothetical protein
MAEEVTLSPESIEALARAMRGTGAAPRPSTSGGSGGGDSSFGAGVRRAVDDTGSALGNLTGFIGRAGGSIGDFTRQVGATTAITEIFGNVVGDGIGFLEDSNRVFQNLSKVGAGFNGDLGALRSAAANARMPLDAFANLVGRNSQALAGLGAGVNNGARRFAELSRAMFEDGQVIRGMTNLGYTLEEANEFLLDNATLLRRQAMLEGMDEKQVAAATLRMAENIAFMAEITGESAEQQRQELVDAQRDGRNIAALRRLEAQGLEGVQESFSEAFTGLQAAGPAAQAFLQDMIQSGAPMSDLTRNFAAMNPQVAEQIRQMAATIKSNEDAATKTARVRAQADRAVQTSASEYVSATNLATASLGQMSGVGQSQADLIAETENYRVGVEQMRRRMAQERGYEEGYGDVTMQEASDRFMQETRDRVAAQTAGGAEGQAVSRELNMATIDLANSAATVNQEIGRNLSANTRLQETVAAGLEGLTSVGRLISSGAREATRLLPGEVEDDVLEANNFRSLFEPLVVGNALLTRVVNFDENSDMVAELQRLAQSGDRTATRILEGMGIPIEARAIGGPVNAGEVYQVGERGPETFVPGVDGAIVPNMDRIMSQMQNTVQTIMPNMRAEAGSMQSTLMQMANNLRGRIEAAATTGAPFDPSDLIDELRGAMSGNSNISTQRLEQLLDTLNQSMLQLVSINNSMSRNGARTVEALRGASGNLLQGVRAR